MTIMCVTKLCRSRSVGWPPHRSGRRHYTQASRHHSQIRTRNGALHHLGHHQYCVYMYITPMVFPVYCQQNFNCERCCDIITEHIGFVPPRTRLACATYYCNTTPLRVLYLLATVNAMTSFCECYDIVKILCREYIYCTT